MIQYSREFMDLVRRIGDCKSKQEEDTIVGREVINLRVHLADAQAQGRMRELIIRMMYCEMLGHRVEFGYIHAVNMTQRPSLTEKRVGYLAATLFLDSSSELLILLVNTLQRDLKSTNHVRAAPFYAACFLRGRAGARALSLSISQACESARTCVMSSRTNHSPRDSEGPDPTQTTQ